jgi:hypothetical protein
MRGFFHWSRHSLSSSWCIWTHHYGWWAESKACLPRSGYRLLGNRRADNYKDLVEELLSSYQKLGCNMSLKIHFLSIHLDHFLENCGNVMMDAHMCVLVNFVSYWRYPVIYWCVGILRHCLLFLELPWLLWYIINNTTVVYMVWL